MSTSTFKSDAAYQIAPSGTKAYFCGSYPPDHWALQPITLEDPKSVASAQYGSSEYVVYLNPTDKRGYRCFIQLTNAKNIASTFNREYTREEGTGLHFLMQLVEEVYSKIVPIVQTAVAGNNSQSIHPETKIVCIGSPSEPSTLHAHIFGRGDPDKEYVRGVKLGGPPAGEIFNMRDGKVQWTADAMTKVVARLRHELKNQKTPYERMGLFVGTLW